MGKTSIPPDPMKKKTRWVGFIVVAVYLLILAWLITAAVLSPTPRYSFWLFVTIAWVIPGFVFPMFAYALILRAILPSVNERAVLASRNIDVLKFVNNHGHVSTIEIPALVFRLDSGIQRSFHVSSKAYRWLRCGDKGILIYKKGARFFFIDFVRDGIGVPFEAEQMKKQSIPPDPIKKGSRRLGLVVVAVYLLVLALLTIAAVLSPSFPYDFWFMAAMVWVIPGFGFPMLAYRLIWRAMLSPVKEHGILFSRTLESFEFVRDGHATTVTAPALVFQLDSGVRISFRVSDKPYNRLRCGDKGTLIYKKDKGRILFVDFVRD